MEGEGATSSWLSVRDRLFGDADINGAEGVRLYL